MEIDDEDDEEKIITCHLPDHHKEQLIKVPPDDPTRCQIITRHGQCQFKSVEGLTKCIMHGRTEAAKLKKDKIKTYILTSLGLDEEYSENLLSNNLLNLRNEIALIRVVLQQKLNSCKSVNDLAIASGSIAQLVAQITQTVTLAHKLEESLGKYMTKDELKLFLVNLSEAIEAVVQDDELKYTLGQAILRIAQPQLEKAI